MCHCHCHCHVFRALHHRCLYLVSTKASVAHVRPVLSSEHISHPLHATSLRISLHVRLPLVSVLFFHPSIELLELTPQQLDFLSGCHHHSTPQVQDNRLRYHVQLCYIVKRLEQARLLASRGCVSFARRPSLHRKIYAFSLESTVRHVHFTTRSACNSSCHSLPSCQLPGELVSMSSLSPYQASISICRIAFVPVLSSRCRSGSHLS